VLKRLQLLPSAQDLSKSDEITKEFNVSEICRILMIATKL
jgi:hypothetical protein